MEATRLIDPAFWSSGSPAAPGAEDAAEILRLPELEGGVLFRTSGSTGESKWIVHSRAGLLLSAASVNRHLGVTAGSCWGLALPLRHVGGFGVVARAREGGCRLAVLPGRWNPADFRRWAKEERVSHSSLVPTQVRDLVAAGIAAPPDIRAVVVGGGLMDDPLGRAARKLGWPVLASYGMTEAGSQIATQGLELLEQTYSCAPLPVLPHWEVRCGDGGLIGLRGASLFTGTLVRSGPEWRHRPREGDWFATADRGRLSAAGLMVLGRSDARVKILGELVDPQAVEREIGVPGLVVVAVPDERRGVRLIAVIEERDDAPAVELRLASYHEVAPGFLRISALRRVPQIPRGELGKVRRAELTRRLAEEGI